MMGGGRGEFHPAAPPDSHTHTNWLHIIVCCRQCLQIFWGGYLPFTLSQCLCLCQPCRLGREATERTLETVTANWERRLWSGQLCDSTQPYLLWSPWHTAALLSQSTEKLQDPSSSPPLWPTVSLTSWSQAWFLPQRVCQRISAEQKPKQTFPIKTHSWKCGSQRVKNKHFISILCTITMHHEGNMLFLMSSG